MGRLERMEAVEGGKAIITIYYVRNNIFNKRKKYQQTAVDN